MTDAANPLTPADAEALSAYLAGDMAPDDVAAFEARMDAEPALAAAADALADALTALRGADEAAVPDGFEQRLAARLDAERSAAPADLGAYRERRAARSRMWLGIGTAAAVLAAGAVMSGTVLQGMGGGGDSAETAALDEAAFDDAGAEAGADMAGGSEAAGAAPVGGPVILNEQAVVADEDALRRRYADLPEAAGVLGLSVSDARPVAQEFTAVVEGRDMTVARLEASSDAQGGTAAGETTAEDGEDPDAGSTESAPAAPEDASQQAGAPGDPCLATITADARAPLVPVRVETLRYDGAEAIAYVLVTATPGAQRLDRTEVWVVAADCSTLVFQQY